MRNYALDTKLLPKVWLTWESIKNGRFNKRYWLNAQTGKKKTTPEPWMLYDEEKDINTWYRGDDDRIICGCYWKTERNNQIWVKSGSSLKYAYAKYHPDIDRIEVAAVEFDTTRQEVPHSWRYIGNRYYIGRDKSIVDQNGNFGNSYKVYQYHTAYSGKELLGMLIRLHTSHSFISEFKKFIGEPYFTIGSGKTVNIEYPYHFQQWYMTVQKTRTKGKQQKLTDELTALPLSDTTGFSEKYPIKTDGDGRYSTRMTGVIYFEQINEQLSVLRAFTRNGFDQLNESWRMYLDDKNLSRIVSKSDEGWVPEKQIKCRWGNCSYIANVDEAIEKCPRIKYVLRSIKDVEESQKVDFLITALRFPEIEQLAKFGYGEKCLSITGSNYPKADLKYMFGNYYNDKGKNLLDKIGLTKKQFDYYMEDNGYHSPRTLSTMRIMFGNNLSHMDQESFVKYYKNCGQMRDRFWRGLEYHTDGLDIDLMKFFKNMCRLAEKRNNVWQVVADTISDYRRLDFGTQPDIDWYFDDLSDLTRAHDAIGELKRMQDDERRARWDREAAERHKKEEEKRIKLDKERKTYEYEDDRYIIRLPKDGAEIVREGNMQHICIGGYVSSHSMGNTNLFFLREKSAENVPFYAIEMSNDKRIVQIHGFGNKWLGNNPEAIPTVIRWLRKNGISCSDAILTCKAKGYGSINDYVPMPVVD